MKRGDANRWLWLYVYLCRRYCQPDTHPLQRAAILCFWQTVNQLRSNLIMDGQGLTRFAERYYQSALGRGGDYQGNMRRLWAGRADVAEIKSGPLAFKPAFVGKIARGLLANASLSLPSAPTFLVNLISCWICKLWPPCRRWNAGNSVATFSFTNSQAKSALQAGC
jgi:hypothetical protein